MAQLPKLLVIDDEIGVEGSDHHRLFLQHVGAADAAGKKVPDVPYEFEFIDGRLSGGEYSIDLILDRIRDRWEPQANRLWALVLLDVKFGTDLTFGLRVLQGVRDEPELGDAVPVVMLTGEQQRHQAALRRADGFMPKVLATGDSGMTRTILDQKVFEMGLVPDSRPVGGLVGNSLAMLQTLRRIRQVIHNGTIPQMCRLGEPGVGKTQLPMYAHYISRGPTAPYRETTADRGNSELHLGAIFGAWPHAYNNAPASGQAGLFESAHGGTFFLDEVANLHDEAQMRLLEARAGSDGRTRTISRYGTPPLTNHALLERCRRHITGELDDRTGRIRVDASFITASNEALDDPQERERLHFRRDLWDGLLPAIRVPNLNERRSDIRELFTHLLRQRFGLQQQVNVDDEVFAALENVDWSVHGTVPGLAANVRGLRDVVTNPRLRYREFGVVTVSQLPPELLGIPKATGALPRATTGANLSEQPTPGRQHAGQTRAAFGATLVQRYRQDLELLLETLRQTQDTFQSKPVPARALHRLLNQPFSGAEIARTIKRLFFKPVFDPSRSLERCLREHGLAELQQWVLGEPLLREYVGDWDRLPHGSVGPSMSE